MSLIKNKHDYCRGKDCMKNFSRNLRKPAAKIITYGKKEMIPLTNKGNKSYRKQKVCHICKKKLVLMTMIKNVKSEITVITLENIEALHIIFII